MASLFASRLSLIAFATVSVRGVITGAEFEGTLKSALFAAVVFYGLGLVVGELARRVIEDNVRSEFERLITENANNNPQ